MSEAIHFVRSLPVSTLIRRTDNLDQSIEKIRLARSFSGVDEEQRQDLVARVADLVVRRIEFYKATNLPVNDWPLR